ncbi:unnamed protein product [Closterium sp. NIES-54]
MFPRACLPPNTQVRGSDADNLPLTRVVQRDLWEHQLFHGSCDGKRLLVVPWPDKTHHGVGSQIHVMSTFLSLALIHNRTLVPAPGSYDRAFTETCNYMIANSTMPSHPHAPPLPLPFTLPATNTGGAWGCYFFPIVNPDCERLVTDMTANNTMPSLSSDKVGHNRLAASADPVVHLNSSCDSQMKFEARAATHPARPHGKRPARPRPSPCPSPPHPAGALVATPVNVHWWRSQSTRFMLRRPSPHTCHATNKERHTAYGLHTASHLSRYTETQRLYTASYPPPTPPLLAHICQVHWWRSQSTRFMMRWPSPHTCHQTNKERHTAYGLHTASHLSRYTETQSEIIRAVAGNASEAPESKKLAEISAGPPGPIEGQVWAVRGFTGCDETCMGAADAKAIRETYAAVGGEPFVVRPIVSVHVRQSDKGTEMRLSPLATHMFFVHRLRRHVPDLRYVWLNTEMEVRAWGKQRVL